MQVHAAQAAIDAVQPNVISFAVENGCTRAASSHG
jgi:hypothetical protein